MFWISGFPIWKLNFFQTFNTLSFLENIALVTGQWQKQFFKTAITLRNIDNSAV